METTLIGLALSTLCAFFLALTLRRPGIATKGLASLAFLSAGALFAVGSNAPLSYRVYLVVGLALGAAGDVFLAFPSRKAFVLGLVSFLLGHLGYLLAFADLVSPGDWLHPWTLAPAVSVGVIGTLLWPHLGKMCGPVLAYLVVIAFMLVAAIGVYRLWSGESPSEKLVLIGAVLFAVSDVFVAKARFVRKDAYDRVIGLPLYYAGQLCLVWSLL